MTVSIRIFRYIPADDAFFVTDEYRRIADDLNLTEWHAAVWIGRLFILDNDLGEHWFDNWNLRADRELAPAIRLSSERDSGPMFSNLSNLASTYSSTRPEI